MPAQPSAFAGADIDLERIRIRNEGQQEGHVAALRVRLIVNIDRSQLDKQSAE
jgi:hypothetical protein